VVRATSRLWRCAIKIWTLTKPVVAEQWQWLDRQRLVAQHHEWHTIWNSVTIRHYKWLGWEAEKYLSALWQVHEDVVAEMRERGMTNHQTPIERPVVLCEQVSYTATPKRIHEERWALVCRSEGVYRGRGEEPAWFDEMSYTYILQGGCLHDGQLEDVGNGNRLCLQCKRWVLSKDDIWQRR